MLDWLAFSIGPMDIGLVFADIGVRYLMIPLLTAGLAWQPGLLVSEALRRRYVRRTEPENDHPGSMHRTSPRCHRRRPAPLSDFRIVTDRTQVLRVRDRWDTA